MDRELPITGHLDLRRTFGIMGLFGANTWIRREDSGIWYARRTPDGPGTVQIQHAGDVLRARGWGPGAEQVLELVPQLVGLDCTVVSEIPGAHPLIRELKKKYRGVRLGKSRQIYSRLVSVALAQKVTGMNSKAALRSLAWRWGETAPGPNPKLQLLPEPKTLKDIPYYAFHELGIEQHRALLVKRIADRASALERAVDMPFIDARKHLMKLRGIGPWTSAIVIGGTLGDPDAVPIGDYHVPNWVAYNLAGEPRADDRRMLELLEPYVGYRGIVARMIKSGGRSAPKYGPKSEVRDIRKM